MGARSRSRDGPLNLAGRYTVYLTSGGQVTSISSNGIRSRETCNDVTMPKPYVVDHPLTITKRLAIPFRVNGVYTYPSGMYSRVEYENYNFAYNSSYANSPTLLSTDTNYWKTKALANLNPFRPKVDLPLLIWELQDLPRMLRDAGFLLSGQIKRLMKANDPGSLYLAFQFGWAPLVSDLLKMFDFVDSIEQRKEYLLNLEKGHRVKRTLASGTIAEATLPDSTLSAPGTGANVLTMGVRDRSTLKVWFTTNAKLVDPLPKGTAFNTMSRDIVMGMALQPERLWDFVPWTWLIDYFVNVGDYLEAWGTLSRLRVTRMNLMIERRRTRFYNGRSTAPGISASSGLLETSSKQRFVYANPTPNISYTPFLTGGQVMILGALASTRTKRAIRGGR